jgi:hypothetical protein
VQNGLLFADIVEQIQFFPVPVLPFQMIFDDANCCSFLLDNSQALYGNLVSNHDQDKMLGKGPLKQCIWAHCL